jgi:uncharacterized protein
MYISSARIETANASGYLQQLCKHFGHKVEASFDASKGSVLFEMGPCEFSADETALTILCRAGDEEGGRLMREVVGSHLARFAFREKLRIEWVTLPPLNRR